MIDTKKGVFLSSKYLHGLYSTFNCFKLKGGYFIWYNMNYQAHVLGNSYFESRNWGCYILRKLDCVKLGEKSYVSRSEKSNWRIISNSFIWDSKGNSRAQNWEIFHPESGFPISSSSIMDYFVKFDFCMIQSFFCQPTIMIEKLTNFVLPYYYQDRISINVLIS